jgi:hypothetical protein
MSERSDMGEGGACLNAQTWARGLWGRARLLPTLALHGAQYAAFPYWTPRFRAIFARAGMSLEDPANKMPLPGHYGPQPR